ncbi:DUF1622 domain-containing protein [Deinococcus sonorensis]|uniref:DUF1622 domain-containing protein n=2 Tax=Deinococcus sonorensis TaxID=309891 RepID=A0AAU7UA88_9DEIO
MDGLPFRTVSLLIEAVGSLYVVGYAVAALLTLLRGQAGTRITAARLLVAEGALAGLNFKVAATLLRTIELHSWPEIGMFVAVFALRTLLKRVFSWEQRRLRADAAGRAPLNAPGP